MRSTQPAQPDLVSREESLRPEGVDAPQVGLVTAAQLVMYADNEALGPPQRVQRDCFPAPMSTAAATGGVRRLRDELNAALLDQRRQQLEVLRQYTRRKSNTAPPTPTRGVFLEKPAPEAHRPASGAQARAPTWSDLDAALALLKFQSCETASGHANRSKSGSLDAEHVRMAKKLSRRPQCATRMSRVAIPDQVVESARREPCRPSVRAGARLEISRKYLILWRNLAHATVVARTLTRRAASHRRDSLVRHAFHAWQLYWHEQQSLHHSYRAVTSQSNKTLLSVVYRRWRHAFRFQCVYRALEISRRRRLLRAALYTWQVYIRLRRTLVQLQGRSQSRTVRAVWHRWRQCIRRRRERISHNKIAQTHFLMCQWEALVRQVQHHIERRRIVEKHLKKRAKRTLKVYFDGWLEFLEHKKRWRLGVKWYRQHLLESALSGWKTAHDRVQYMKTLEKRSHKKMCRYRLRRCLQQWWLAVRYLRQQAAHLKQISIRLLVRRAFGKLYRFSLVLIGRERELQKWKYRRALQTWLRRADERRNLALRVMAVARMRSTFVKRTYGWHPWRLAYQRSAGTRAIRARVYQRELRTAWDGLKTVAAEHNRHQSIMALVSDRVVSRRLRLAIFAWADYTYASEVRRQWIQLSTALHDSALKKRSFGAWRRWPVYKRRQESLNAAASCYILKRAMARWRVQADRFRRERSAKLGIAEQRRGGSLARKCFFAWSAHARQQQLRLCRWAFASWCRAGRFQRAEQAFTAVARSLELHRHWHRWYGLVRYNVELNQRRQRLCAEHERRAKHAYFIERWLSKLRRYRRATLLISALGHKTTWQWSFAKWKLWRAHQSRMRRAIAFRDRSLQLRCLHMLHAATVGQVRTADGHCRYRQLTRVWNAWLVSHKRSMLSTVADSHCRRRRLSRALSSLQDNTGRTQTMRAYQQRADLWRRAVILQTWFGHWHFTAQKLIQLRQTQERLRWYIVGARHFRTWRFTWVMQQKARLADVVHRQVLMKRGFNLWLQITKRRLVAMAMWKYAMARIRSARALAAWNTYTASRRRARLGIDALRYRQHERMLQRCFSHWELMVAVEAFRSSCMRQCSMHWARQCWMHWKRFMMIKHMRHARRSNRLRTFFSRLRRFAIRQQAVQLVYQQSARAALDRALHAWRVEFRLARAQRTASRILLQKCVRDWARYVSGCRQQREWIRYIQRLHQVHETRDEDGAFEAQMQLSGQYDSCGSVHDQVAHRDLQKRVLHAWYLATKSFQRRRHRDRLPSAWVSKPCATPPRKVATRESKALFEKAPIKGRRRAHDASNRVLALRFWSEHLLSRTFSAWKSRSSIVQS